MAKRGRPAREPRPEVQIDLRGLTDRVIGRESGISEHDLERLEPRLNAALATLESERKAGLHAFLELPAQRAALDETRTIAETLREECDCLVLLGVGGSAAGARALCGALAPRAGPGGSGGVEVVIADTIDPRAFVDLLDRLDLRRTVFNVVSKSGETTETLAQFLLVRERLLRDFGATEYARHLLITTDPASGSLRQIVNDEGLPTCDFPASVGGRFSILSPVHLLPAAMLGIDVEALLDGASAMDARCREAGSSPAARLAGARYLLDTLHGFQTAVLMPYSQRLIASAQWWAQLWAESLGKRAERDGGSVAVGQTPVVAVGASDQHSQMQLYLQGPADKVFTFLRVEDHGARLEVPQSFTDLPDIAYLGGRSLGEILNDELVATQLALAHRGRPTLEISLPAVTPHAMGQLVFLLELEAVLTAALLGVDPYGQPGIEEVKRLVFAMGGRPGFDAEREEVERWRRRDPRSAS